VVKRQAQVFPGHYPMTRKTQLKQSESAPTVDKYKFGSEVRKFVPTSPQALKAKQKEPLFAATKKILSKSPDPSANKPPRPFLKRKSPSAAI